MKTFEELKSMNHEDLIREVQVLQEEFKKEQDKSCLWYGELQKAKTKFNAFRETVKSVVILLD